MHNTPRHILVIILILLICVATAVGVYFLLVAPNGNSSGNSPSIDISQIDYSEQGYLVNEAGIILENSTFTANNPHIPAASTTGVANSQGAFTYIEVSGFPKIVREDNASAYTADLNNDIMELCVSKAGSIRDKESGKLKLIIDVKYTVLIDKTTSEILLCTIQTEQDGALQKYYFITSQNTKSIQDILNRAYL